jgi:hypothetical protein
VTPAWDYIGGLWDDHDEAWDFQEVESLGDMLFVGTWEGKIYRVSHINNVDTGLMFIWETKPYMPKVAVRVNEVRLQARGMGILALEYSIDYGDTWIGLGGYSLSENTQEFSWFPNKWCDNFKFRLTAPAHNLKLTRPFIDTIDRRQR